MKETLASTVIDGPIDPETYKRASIRVLHLLKQPTQFNESLPRLFLDLITEKNWSMLMERVAQRTHCLQQNGVPWHDTPVKGDVALVEALKASAVVNLENAIFKKNTPLDELDKMALDNLPRWHNVILESKPDVVICGGTFDAVWKALGGPDWKKFSTGMQYFTNPDCPTVLYVEMPHPSARYPAAMTHTFLAASTREILDKVASLKGTWNIV